MYATTVLQTLEQKSLSTMCAELTADYSRFLDMEFPSPYAIGMRLSGTPVHGGDRSA
jgi:hypothetical protein